MATKKKLTKKSTKSKKSAGRNVKSSKKRAKKVKAAKKLANKSERRSSARKKAVAKTKTKSRRKEGTSTKRAQRKPPARARSAFSRRPPEPSSGDQSGDLQGLSRVESADSQSVDELMDEGNAFEAGVVGGVEDADEHDGREVHTREVPEDDVPGEYLDDE